MILPHVEVDKVFICSTRGSGGSFASEMMLSPKWERVINHWMKHIWGSETTSYRISGHELPKVLP